MIIITDTRNPDIEGAEDCLETFATIPGTGMRCEDGLSRSSVEYDRVTIMRSHTVHVFPIHSCFKME